MADYDKVAIEPGWQFITIPVRYGYWDVNTSELIYDQNVEATIKNYFCDQIADITGYNCSYSIEFCLAKIGDEGKYFTYIPDFTDDDSEHNFKLGYLDVNNDVIEYTAFLVNNITNGTIIINHLESELTWINGGTF